jgi:hypothetical protein
VRWNFSPTTTPTPTVTPKSGRQIFANLPVVSLTLSLSKDSLTGTKEQPPTPNPRLSLSSLVLCHDLTEDLTDRFGRRGRLIFGVGMEIRSAPKSERTGRRLTNDRHPGRPKPRPPVGCVKRSFTRPTTIVQGPAPGNPITRSKEPPDHGNVHP